MLHGAGWLSLKLERGPALERARLWGQVAAPLAILLFAAGGAFVAWGGLGFALQGTVDTQGPSNPHLAGAVAAPGAWLANFGRYPLLLIAPVAGFLGPLLAFFGIRSRNDLMVFAGSSLANVGIISTVGLSMFPFILPSTIDPGRANGLIASSSHLTLLIMLLVTLVFLPIVLVYTAWAYRVMFGRVTSS